MLKLGTLRWKGRCKRHPRYNPVDGEGAVQGACQNCLRLLEIHLHHKKLIEMMRAFGPVRLRKKQKPLPRIEDRQVSLFDGLE
jgi:hypothetical protein